MKRPAPNSFAYLSKRPFSISNLLEENTKLNDALCADRTRLHLGISALQTTTPDGEIIVAPVHLLEKWSRNFGLCAYVSHGIEATIAITAYLDVVVGDKGREIHYRNENGKYRMEAETIPDITPGFEAGFQDYKCRMPQLSEATSFDIAIIKEPEFASLMEIADVSIVLCALPQDYSHHYQICIPGKPSYNAVLDALCEIRSRRRLEQLRHESTTFDEESEEEEEEEEEEERPSNGDTEDKITGDWETVSPTLSYLE